MDDNSFVSEQKRWIDIAYWVADRSNISKYIEAAEAVEKVNAILGSAPQDVGGGIGFRYSKKFAENLYYQWQDLCKFTDGIHYEITELIDVPFTQKVSVLLNNLYDLNPKNFKTSEKILFVPIGSSLEKLLINMVDDEKLKQSYKSMVDNLNDDNISLSLIECIEVANYWADQFDKSEKIQTIAEEYMELYNEKWKEYSEEEKLSIINKYAIDIGTILNEKGKKRTKQAKIQVDWNVNNPDYVNDENSKYERGKTGAIEVTGEVNGMIYINYEWTNKSSTGFEMILNVVTHEVRHTYQGQVFYTQQKWDVPESIANKWSFDKEAETDYWRRYWEIDARGFAAISEVF